MSVATIDLAPLNALVTDGLLTRRAHPSAPLLIWNYTAKAAYDRVWNEYTMMCRGLITDADGKVIARPFPKFFNVEEWTGALAKEVPNEPFEVYEKLDGSLGILYHVGDEAFIASRGSFESDQAREGTKMLRAMARTWPRDTTLLFEILFPENRIVVNYGDRRELVLLAAISTDSGAEIPIDVFGGLAKARRYDGVADIAAIRELGKANEEGFVIRFASGLRLKVKLADYVRLHRLLTGVTPRRVWEILSAGQSLKDFESNVPEEFYTWLNSVADTLRSRYGEIERQCAAELTAGPITDVDRKTIAERFKACKYPAVLFSMLDGKNYAAIIWKLIYPPAASAFRCDIDAT